MFFDLIEKKSDLVLRVLDIVIVLYWFLNLDLIKFVGLIFVVGWIFEGLFGV